jgi:hypothetical protein
MKYTVKMDSRGIIYIPSFRHSEVDRGGYTDTQRKR